jgi:phosphohistidine phosphatase
MKLYVTRHGPAEDEASSGLDGDRALSDAGRKRVRSVAKALVDLDEAPHHLISSPLVRAVQTAEIIAIGTRLEDRGGTVEIRREIAPGGEWRAFVRALAAEGRKRVMLVGHEPDLSDIVASLLGTFARAFDKAMVVGLQLRAHDPRDSKEAATAMPRGRLRFVLDPRTLRLDPDARDPAS